MFRLESYIAPIIVGYVDKYVKNFRPQDAQISLFSGDVALQNLDLKLSALEEDLDLPLKFISGHVHELCIHIPWVKLAFEPIVLSINTIEFVVQLKDEQSETGPKSPSERKKVEYEPPPGYVSSLVTKIIHNVVIKCNNIILKFIEDDIVLSMNIQELTLSAADPSWNQGFIDISPIKFLVRKLVKVTDLTVCLDRRNSLGKIEVILEPVLYRCSLEARILTKYNFSTKQKTSLNRIDVFIKTFDINLSTEQIPMLFRLSDIFSNLPEKSKIESETASLEELHETQESGNQGLVLWLWNSMPTIFSEDAESTTELQEAHILHFGTYIQDIRVVFKSQETLSESSSVVKKVRFTPFLSLYVGGSYFNLVNIGKEWMSVTAGFSEMAVNYIGDCPCRSPMTLETVFSFTSRMSENYFKGSLFDADSLDNSGAPFKYNTNWVAHVEKFGEKTLLQKTGAVALDLVKCKQPGEVPTSSSGSNFNVLAASRKNLTRVFVGPFVVRFNADFDHRLAMLRGFFDSRGVQRQAKDRPLGQKLAPPTEEDVEYLLSGIQMQLVVVTVIKPSLEIHMWDHIPHMPKKKALKRSSMFLPRLVVSLDRAEVDFQKPQEPTLVPTISQLREIPTRLENAPFYRAEVEVTGVEACLEFSGQKLSFGKVNQVRGNLKVLIQPEMWRDKVTTDLDLAIKSCIFQLNPAQICLVSSLLQSVAQRRLVEVLNTNLLSDISNQQLVELVVTLEQLLFGYSDTKDYRTLQLEVKRLSGIAHIPVLKTQTHVLEWPYSHNNLAKSKRSHFLSVLYQVPRHEGATSCPPIVDLRVENGGICLDSLACRFLNYEVKRWSFPVYEGPLLSSKSDTAVVLDTPQKKPKVVETKLPPSVHSSSDRDANTSMIVETEDSVEVEERVNFFNLAKHMVVQIDVGETTAYLPAKLVKGSIFDETEGTKEGIFADSDCLVVGIPGVTIISSAGQVEINTLETPIKLASKFWTHGKLSFPWNIQFSNAQLLTIQNRTEFVFLQPNTTNVIISINDIDQLAFDLHVDMQPILVNFMLDQMNFIMSNLSHLLNLNVVRKVLSKQREPPQMVDFSYVSSEECSKEMKEFLSYTQNSSNHVSKTSKAREKKPLKGDLYSLLLQFTLSKVSLVFHNCSPGLKCSKQFTVTLEDIMMSFNKRPNFHKVSLKVASAKGICFEKVAVLDEFMKNENLGFHFYPEEGSEGNRNPSVVELLVTSADKTEVQSKWKVKLDSHLNTEHAQLTEVLLKVQRLDVILDPEMLQHFIGIFRLEKGPEKEPQTSKLMAVSDLPLLDFQSKGLRVFVPLSGVNKNCDVYILSIDSIAMDEPSNKIDRKPLRPDVFHKALQLGILDIYGTKVENRQYEIQFTNISLSTGNWVKILESVYRQRLDVYHENPAVEWNKKGSPLAGDPRSGTLSDALKIFRGFNLGIVYAPNIVFENALICEEAIEFNCTNDMAINMNLAQLTLAAQLGDSYETLMKLWRPSPDILVFDAGLNEFVSVRSTLFRSTSTPTKTTKAEEILKEIDYQDQVVPLRPTSVMRRAPKLEKRTQSLMNFERKSIEDSGIESMGASNDKRQLKRRISKLKQQPPLTETILLPYEVYFNGGVFTFKLFAQEAEVQKKHPDPDKEAEEYPLLSVFVDRPNVFLRQTNHERSLKVSLTDLKLSLAEVVRRKRIVDVVDVPIFDTRAGETDQTGARKPLVEFRHVSSIGSRPDEIEVLVQRPVKLALSHLKIKSLLQIWETVRVPLEKKRSSRPYVPSQPVKRQKLFQQVASRVGSLRRLSVTLSQVMFEMADKQNYDLKLVISSSEAHFSLLERIERINCLISVQNVILTSLARTVLHPTSLSARLVMSQETWKREPIVTINAKWNLIQLDLSPTLLDELLLVQEQLKSVIESKTEAEEPLLSEPQLSSGEHVQVSLPSPVQSVTSSREVQYEDDLRAGAFQFIHSGSASELPLPYQVQVFSNKDESLICWRYPQPRSLTQVKVFPIPVQFYFPTYFECVLEYFCGTRETFKVARKFEVREDSVGLELPSQIICSSIWRVKVTQITLKPADDEEYEEQSLEEALSNESLLKRASTPEFSPQVFVSCMRIDSLYSPTLIPNIEVLLHISHVRVNVMASLSSGRLPKFLQDYTYVGDPIPLHPLLTLSLDNFRIFASVFHDLSAALDSQGQVGVDFLDYSTFRYQPLVESFRVSSFVELSREMLKLNCITNLVHLHYGQPTSHAIAVLKRQFESHKKPELREFCLMMKYVVCNNSSGDIVFGQVGTQESRFVPRRGFIMYAFPRTPERQIRVMMNEATSGPIHIDKPGVTKLRMGDQILLVKVEVISSFQKQVTFLGQVQFFNMTANSFDIQYKVYMSNVDTTANSVVDEVSVGESGSWTSAMGKCNEGAQESMRMKLSTHVKKGWSGEIPLKEIIPNGKPWLVKVPAANKFNEMCFWIRIIREDIEELRSSRSSCPQRVLVIIWPLFVLKSNLTVHSTAYEAAYDQNYSIFGRGERKEMQMAGTSENDHELTFKLDFKSNRDEDKRNTVLSYQFVDKKKFFTIPAPFTSIEAAIGALEAQVSASWPCSREEELRWTRENSFQETTLPIYKFGASHDLSCALMMTISPWCLFINSSSCVIRLRSPEGESSCIVQPNNVVMPFSVESFFVMDLKVTDEWTTVGNLYLNQFQKMAGESYLVPEEGSVTITVAVESQVVSLLVHSSSEDGMRVLIVSSLYVISNYSSHDLSFYAFAIQSNDKDVSLTSAAPKACSKIVRATKESFNAKGTNITLFTNLSSPKSKPKFGTSYNFFLCLFHDDLEPLPCPLNLGKACNRRSFSVWKQQKFVPISVSIVQHQDQLFISIYNDSCPSVAIQNLTDFQFHVAQAVTTNPSKVPAAVNETDSRLSWNQVVLARQLVFYTPPVVDEVFPEIQTVEVGVIFSCVGSSVRWSKPVKVDENRDVSLEVPLYGDIKVSVDSSGKMTKVTLDYIRQDSEFSAKDIRNRLSHPVSSSSTTQLMEKRRQTVEVAKNEPEASQKRTFEPVIHAFLEGFRISLFTDCDKTFCERFGTLMLDFNQINLLITESTRNFYVSFRSFQAENSLFSTGEFDFPVILCPQAPDSSTKLEIYRDLDLYGLEGWLRDARKDDSRAFCAINLCMYREESGCRSVEVKLKALRAFVEDTYITALVDYLNECFGANALYEEVLEGEKVKCAAGEVLVPKIVQQQAALLSEPIRIRNISISGFHALISVHTCLRMYIALDHSPLDFSVYEKSDLFTLPEKLIANSLTMHYLSGVIFGVGWICGSLEILGSPSGLARSVSTGVRDFVTLPVQGLFKGPWGFLVGCTQGSTSLVRNVTAGTVNSVTKLAASFARNIDRLTLDSEHLQRTDAIRRNHPQSVTDGFTQGLTGFGISLLGALGGLAHHPLQASSAGGVVAGIGKGIVGAVTKPISGAAELVALTGQGVLQRVGFNSIPSPRSLMADGSHDESEMKNVWHILEGAEKAEPVLFCKFATLKDGDGFQKVIVCVLPRDFIVFDEATYERLFSFNFYKVKINFDPEDITLVVVTPEDSEPSFCEHDEYHISPRTIQYVQQSLSLSNLSSTLVSDDGVEPEAEEAKTKEEELVAFFMEEGFARHFVEYCKLQQRRIHLYLNEFSPYE